MSNNFLFTILGLLWLARPSYGQEIQVNLKLLPQDAWTKEEQSLVQDAAEKAFRRLAEAHVANCAYRNAYKEKSKDQLRKAWGNKIPVINKSRLVSITIIKKELKENVLGMAQVGRANLDKRLYQINNLEIQLSKEALFQHLNRDSKTKQKDLWVNVIAHEVAHNLGFLHGSGGTWADNYPGYFVTELGYCAMSEGRSGSGDPK